MMLSTPLFSFPKPNGLKKHERSHWATIPEFNLVGHNSTYNLMFSSVSDTYTHKENVLIFELLSFNNSRYTPTWMVW